MWCSLRVGVITIGVLVIIVAGMSLIFTSWKLIELNSWSLYEESNCKDEEITQRSRILSPDNRTGQRQLPLSYTLKTKKKKISKSLKFGAGLSILVFNLITIHFTFLLFAATSQDIDKNQRRRHLLLPFIIWHSVEVLLFAVAGITLLSTMKMSTFMLVSTFIGIAGLGIMILCVVITTKYFISLSPDRQSYVHICQLVNQADATL